MQQNIFGVKETKAAAKCMAASLTAQGVKVSHAQMLEALAAGFGLNNWRTLRAKLEARPSENTATTGSHDGEQWWRVLGRYADTGERFEAQVLAHSALMACVVYEVSTSATGVDIIIDEATCAEMTAYVCDGESHFVEPRRVISDVLELADRLYEQGSLKDVDAVKALERLYAGWETGIRTMVDDDALAAAHVGQSAPVAKSHLLSKRVVAFCKTVYAAANLDRKFEQTPECVSLYNLWARALVFEDDLASDKGLLLVWG